MLGYARGDCGARLKRRMEWEGRRGRRDMGVIVYHCCSRFFLEVGLYSLLVDLRRLRERSVSGRRGGRLPFQCQRMNVVSLPYCL